MLQKDEAYLHLVLEYIPETVYKVVRHYNKSKQTIPISFIKVSNFLRLFYNMRAKFQVINYVSFWYTTVVTFI